MEVAAIQTAAHSKKMGTPAIYRPTTIFKSLRSLTTEAISRLMQQNSPQAIDA
jgi:hypothetical protein